MIPPRVVQSWPTVAAYLSERRPALVVEQLPVRTDIREAIALSMTHLNSLFDSDRDDEPYFFVNAMPDGTGKMFHSVNIGIPHVVGRSLLGTMMGEMATGIPFPAEGTDDLRTVLSQFVRQPGSSQLVHRSRPGWETLH